jgi:hypothetical protein
MAVEADFLVVGEAVHLDKKIHLHCLTCCANQKQKEKAQTNG